MRLMLNGGDDGDDGGDGDDGVVAAVIGEVGYRVIIKNLWKLDGQVAVRVRDLMAEYLLEQGNIDLEILLE